MTEVWRDAEAIEVHKNSVHFAKLGMQKTFQAAAGCGK
ncbi:MAG: hypothetical protein K5877_06730 [Lachnospiraceae bacterium]|nr:hypothetical protein [Lachnospiraceae bacterium]